MSSSRLSVSRRCLRSLAAGNSLLAPDSDARQVVLGPVRSHTGPCPRSGLQDLEDAIDRAIGSVMADADRDNAIDPAVLRGRSLEQWIDAEVIACRVGHLASLNSLHDIGRTVAHATICHADQSIVLCLQYKAHVQFRGAIVVYGLPVAAAIQHLTG